jgi:hypothetical protein
MKYMRHTILSVCCLLIVNMAAAQLSVYGTAGVSGLRYSPEGGTSSMRPGFGGGLGYYYAVSSSWKAGAALEVATYNSKASFGDLLVSYEQGTGTDKSRISYLQKGYEEKQNITLISIPLTMQYHTDGSIEFCLSGGLKLGLPVSAQANIGPRILDVSGEYEYEGQTYTNLPQHGLPKEMDAPATKSKIDLGYSVAAILEAGALIGRIYAGLYLDYGLNDMRKLKDKRVLEYWGGNPPIFEYNSILNTALVDKVKLFSTGLKVRVQF